MATRIVTGGRLAAKSVAVIGFDGTPDGLSAVEAGTLYASVAQQPTELGRIAVQNAVKVAEGKKGTKSVMVPVKVVTKENVAASAADEATGKGEEAGGRCCQGARGLLGW